MVLDWQQRVNGQTLCIKQDPLHHERPPENEESLPSGMGKRCTQVTRVTVLSWDSDFQKACQAS